MNSVVIVKLVNLVIWRDIFTGGCREEDTVYIQVQEYFMNEQTKTWLLNIRTGQMTSRLFQGRKMVSKDFLTAFMWVLFSVKALSWYLGVPHIWFIWMLEIPDFLILNNKEVNEVG